MDVPNFRIKEIGINYERHNAVEGKINKPHSLETDDNGSHIITAAVLRSAGNGAFIAIYDIIIAPGVSNGIFRLG